MDSVSYMNQIVYRVQNHKGSGPYRPSCMELMDEDLRHELNLHGTSNNRPLSIMDIGRKANRNEIHGFVTLEQCNQWFPRDLRIKLSKYGFHIAMIKDVVVTAVGQYQCLFIGDRK